MLELKLTDQDLLNNLLLVVDPIYHPPFCGHYSTKLLTACYYFYMVLPIHILQTLEGIHVLYQTNFQILLILFGKYLQLIQVIYNHQVPKTPSFPYC